MVQQRDDNDSSSEDIVYESSEEEVVFKPTDHVSYEEYVQSIKQNDENGLKDQQRQVLVNSLLKKRQDEGQPQPLEHNDYQSPITKFPKPTKLQQGLLSNILDQEFKGTQNIQNDSGDVYIDDPINISQDLIRQTQPKLTNQTRHIEDSTINIASENRSSGQFQQNQSKQQQYDQKKKVLPKDNQQAQNHQQINIQQRELNLPSSNNNTAADQVQQSKHNLQQQNICNEMSNYTQQNKQSINPMPTSNNQHVKTDLKIKKSQRKIYSEYLSKKDQNIKVQLGRVFQGKFRVNSKNHNDGYVQVDGLPHQVLVKGLRNQNRAIDGDVVTVQVNLDQDWFTYKFLVEESDAEGINQSQNHNQMSPRQKGANKYDQIKQFQDIQSNKDFKLSSEDIPQSSDDDSRDKNGVVLGSSPDSEGRYSGCLSKSPRDLNDIIGTNSGNDTDTGAGYGFLEPILEEAESVIELEEESSTDSGEEEVVNESEDPTLGQIRTNTQMTDDRNKEIQTGNKNQRNNQQKRTSSFRQRQQEALGRERREAPWWQAQNQEEAIKLIVERLEEMQYQSKCQVRITGTIIGIKEFSNRREHVVGSVTKVFSGPRNWTKDDPPPTTECLLQVKCIDQRLPTLLLVGKHIKDLQALVGLDFNSLKNKILFGKVQRWSSSDLFPTFQVTSLIGNRGVLGDEVKALLFQENIEWNQYPEQVMGSLDLNVGPISQLDLEQRRDYRDNVVFTIDPLTAKDLDDAISIEKLGNQDSQRYLVQVHIADVSHFVPAKSALNDEAENRSTSVYLVNSVIPMLPPKLCEYLCSLNPGKDSLTYTIEWEMDLEGQVYNIWIGKSIINSCVKLSYNLVQEIIENTFDASKEFFGVNQLEVPKIKQRGVTWSRIMNDCILLHKVAQALRRKRYDDGALRLDLTHLYFDINKEGLPQGLLSFEQKEANQLIEEFALKANTTISGFVSSTFPQNSLLRNHPPPDKQIQEVAKIAQAQGIDIKVGNSKEVQESLQYIKLKYPQLFDAFTSLLVKPMQNASYISTGSPDHQDPATWHHYALCIPFYTHFTSPIRRYPDIVVHRLLTAALQKKAIYKQLQKQKKINQDTNNLKESHENGANGLVQYHKQESDDKYQYDRILLANNGVPDAKILSEQCDHYNGRKLAAKSAQEKCVQLYLLHHLCMSPSIVKGIVTRLGGCHFITVYVPHIGQEFRVKLNAIQASLISILVPHKCVFLDQLQSNQELDQPLDLDENQFTYKQEIIRSTIKAQLQGLVHMVGQDRLIKNRKYGFQDRNKGQVDKKRRSKFKPGKKQMVHSDEAKAKPSYKDNQIQDKQKQHDLLSDKNQQTQIQSQMNQDAQKQNKPKAGNDQLQLNWQQQLLQQKYGLGQNEIKDDDLINNDINSESVSQIESSSQYPKEIRYYNQFTNTYHKIQDINQYNNQQLKDAQSNVAEVRVWDNIKKGNIKNKDQLGALQYPTQINQFQEVPLILFSYMSDDDVTPKSIGAILYIQQDY